MKKLLFTMAAVAFFATASMAQMSFGLKGGLNISKVKYDFDGDTEDSDSRLSVNLGGFMVYDLADKIALQPELLLSFEGGVEDDGGNEVVGAYTMLNIPVLLRYSVAESFHILAGPQIGLNIAANAKFDGDSESIDDVSTLGIGLGLGAAYNVNEKIDVHFRYNAGLSNWYNGEGSSDFKVKINTIQFGVGYKLK